MEQTVASLMSTSLRTVRADDTIEAVSRQLRDSGVPFVPVVEPPGETLIGIISADDIVRFNLSQRDPAAVHAWEICAYKPLEVSADAALSDVARLMLDRQAHHVVVMNKDCVIGVVSSLDFVKQFIKS